MNARRFVAAIASLPILLMAAPAWSIPSVIMSLASTGSSSVGECSGGNQVWQVSADIVVHNEHQGPVTFDSTGFSVKYTIPGDPHQTQDTVTVIDDGGFVPGVTLALDETRTFGVTVQMSLPCSAAGASLFAHLILVDGHKEHISGGTFLVSGTPVPAAAIGGTLLAAGLALGLFLMQRRRRPARDESHVDA